MSDASPARSAGSPAGRKRSRIRCQGRPGHQFGDRSRLIRDGHRVDGAHVSPSAAGASRFHRPMGNADFETDWRSARLKRFIAISPTDERLPRRRQPPVPSKPPSSFHERFACQTPFESSGRGDAKACFARAGFHPHRAHRAMREDPLPPPIGFFRRSPRFDHRIDQIRYFAHQGNAERVATVFGMSTATCSHRPPAFAKIFGAQVFMPTTTADRGCPA